MAAKKIIGIAKRTTNKNGQANQDIAMLWKFFFANHILEKIPNKLSSTIYSVYTDYEKKDPMSPYTVVIGCEVPKTQEAPENMVAKEIPSVTYKKYIAKGNLDEGIIGNTWKKIWSDNINRIYTVDFEVYGEKAKNRSNAEVDIFIAVH